VGHERYITFAFTYFYPLSLAEETI